MSNRVRACKAGKLAEAGSKQRPLTEIEMERDIFKKAAAYFAKEPQRGAR